MSKDSLFLLGIGDVWRYSSNQLRGFDVKAFLVGFHAVQNPWDWDQCWDNSTASHHNKSHWLPALMQIVQQNITSAHPGETQLWIISRSYKWEWKQIFFLLQYKSVLWPTATRCWWYTADVFNLLHYRWGETDICECLLCSGCVVFISSSVQRISMVWGCLGVPGVS